MVQLTLRLTAAAGSASRLVDVLCRLSRRALRTMGCSEVHIAADITAADVYWYCEDWHDERALEERLRSDQFSELLALIETCAAAPLLEFRTVVASRGLEYVASVRGLSPGDRQPGSQP
jgi:quinol monooxygenase YgiN